MEVFVPLVVKPALVKPLRGPSVNSGRSLINLSCICFVCLPDLAVKAAKSTNKNNHKHTVCQWIHCFWINVKYLSVWKLLLTLIYPSYLTYEITFLTIGKSSIIPHSLWSMPSGRAFFQKTTYLNPSVHHWNAKICTSKYTVHFFSLLYILEISCQNSWVLPLSFLECVYFYSECQESWNIMIKKNWQL